MARRVLVVDDEQNIRTVLAALLRRDGYEVVTAEDGDEARQKLRTADPPIQCVLSDLCMPGSAGRCTARWFWCVMGNDGTRLGLCGELSNQTRLTDDFRNLFCFCSDFWSTLDKCSRFVLAQSGNSWISRGPVRYLLYIVLVGSFV